jgi:hypothetical protein
MVNIIDTFLFSEAYEAELLLVKLHLEDPVVNEWVLIESDQTFRGEFTGLTARSLIASDERFAQFRDRITIIEHCGKMTVSSPGYDAFYRNEEWSRRSCQSYLEDKYGDDAWIIVSDVDEAVDGTDPQRRARFLSILDEANGKDLTLEFGHYRYWYDFDNRCYWTGIVTPVVQMGAIRNRKSSLACRARDPRNCRRHPAADQPLFFEYTFCFAKPYMWKKLTSFIHDGYAESDLDVALLTNHWVKALARGERPGRQDVDWLETVVLTEQNSPKYVRDNLVRLKTHAIPVDYLAHRQLIYHR